MIKKIIKNTFVQYFLATLAAIYIKFVGLTSKINKINNNIPEKFWKNNEPFILAFWHNQLMMISYAWSFKTNINILASSHSDGRFGSIIGSFFKLKNIPTSSKNSNVSLKKIFQLVKNK